MPNHERYTSALHHLRCQNSWLSQALEIRKEAIDRKRSTINDDLNGYWLIIPKTHYMELVVEYGQWCDRLVSRHYQEVSLAEVQEQYQLPDDFDVAQLLLPMGLVLTEWLQRGIGLDIDGDTRNIWLPEV